MKTLDVVATVLTVVVLAAGVVMLFGAALTAVFHLAGWHLPWSVFTL